MEGNEECQFSSALNIQDRGEEIKTAHNSPTKPLWIPPRDRDREPLDATPTPTKEGMEDTRSYKSSRVRSAWLCSLSTLTVILFSAFLLWVSITSFTDLQCDSKGCRMPRMSPVYIREKDFDTEHTRFASKYSLYLYREHNVDIDYPVSPSFSLGASRSSLTFPCWFCEGSLAYLGCKKRICKEKWAT